MKFRIKKKNLYLLHQPFERICLLIGRILISYYVIAEWLVWSKAWRAVGFQQIVPNRLTVLLLKMKGSRQFGGIIRKGRVVHGHIIIPFITRGKHLALATT